MESFLTWITSRSSPRTMIILFGLLLAFAPAFVALNRELGGLTPPDALFGYSAQQAYRTFDAESEAGRRFHLIFEVIDLFMIPVYTLLYATTISYTARRLLGQGSRVVTWAMAIPLLAALADYSENAVLMTLLASYPQRLDALAAVAGVFTLTKWALVSAACVLAILGLLGSLGKAILQQYRRRHDLRWLTERGITR